MLARRVFFHVGTLKTGTTYLQRVMWRNRQALRAAGVLVVGATYQDRVWATQTIRGIEPPNEHAAGAWSRICEQVREFDGDAIISHEFFGGASAEQARRAIADLAPAQVHVVCTARDLVKIIPAFWQEVVKFHHSGTFADYEPEPLDANPRQHWSWRTIDTADVLRRWAADLPPERVHVVTMPLPGAPRDLLWRRFAEACRFDPAVADLDIPPVNESMGLVETELLRRLNTRLHGEVVQRGEVAKWVRGYLGLKILAKRDGERFGVDAERGAGLRRRSEDIVLALREAGYDVVGDLDDLLGPEKPDPTRAPEDVSDGELLDVALDVVSRMLSDYRRVSLQRERLRARLDAARRRVAPPPVGVGGRLGVARRRAGARARRGARRLVAGHTRVGPPR